VLIITTFGAGDRRQLTGGDGERHGMVAAWWQGQHFAATMPHMGRAVVLIVALTSAVMVAFLSAAVAQELEFSLDAVRADALSAAGLIFAAVAATSLVTRKK
jgi:hypothetical protein